MYDWLEAESGRAWDMGVFGGSVTVIKARCMVYMDFALRNGLSLD